MAVEVIDGLEAVQIDDPQRQPPAIRPRGGEHLVQMGEEGATVGQFGERVEVGQAQVLVAQGLAAPLGFDHLGEVAVGDEDHDDDGDDHQADIDRDADERRVSRCSEDAHARHANRRSHDQGR